MEKNEISSNISKTVFILVTPIFFTNRLWWKGIFSYMENFAIPIRQVPEAVNFHPKINLLPAGYNTGHNESRSLA